MPETFPAVCFLAATPGSRPCSFSLEAGGLLIEPREGPSARWPYPAVVCEPGGEEHDWVFVSCPDADADVIRLALRDPAAIAALEAVLGRMLELESFNEVLEQLRGVIEAQERIRRDTLKRQRQRARELLE